MNYERARSISEVFNGKDSAKTLKRIGVNAVGVVAVAAITWFSIESPKFEPAKIMTFLTENAPLGSLLVYQFSRGYIQDKSEVIKEEREAKLKVARSKLQGEIDRFGLR